MQITSKQCDSTFMGRLEPLLYIEQVTDGSCYFIFIVVAPFQPYVYLIFHKKAIFSVRLIL